MLGRFRCLFRARHLAREAAGKVKHAALWAESATVEDTNPSAVKNVIFRGPVNPRPWLSAQSRVDNPRVRWLLWLYPRSQDCRRRCAQYFGGRAVADSVEGFRLFLRNRFSVLAY